jgi:archaellum biogenesis ATPase FlaH
MNMEKKQSNVIEGDMFNMDKPIKPIPYQDTANGNVQSSTSKVESNSLPTVAAGTSPEPEKKTNMTRAALRAGKEKILREQAEQVKKNGGLVPSEPSGQQIDPQGNKGLFIVKTASEWLEEAKNQPDPKMLLGNLWYEGELCILFADTNIGKSILAVQIGDSISRGEPVNGFALEAGKQRVLYFDFELAKKQFETRYKDDCKNHYPFDENFRRVEINPDAEPPTCMQYETHLYQELEKAISEWDAQVVIIDNLTYLKEGTEAAKDALPLMKHLKTLKKKYNISILALAHTPKRDRFKGLTHNDLQGSSMLRHFCDSMFVIGESVTDKRLRYIKQIKQRNCEQVYGEDNVVMCEITKPSNFLHFEFIGYGKEKDHLRVPSDKETTELEATVKQLKSEGKSFRDIAAIVGKGKTTVERMCKK